MVVKNGGGNVPVFFFFKKLTISILIFKVCSFTDTSKLHSWKIYKLTKTLS